MLWKRNDSNSSFEYFVFFKGKLLWSQGCHLNSNPYFWVWCKIKRQLQLKGMSKKKPGSSWKRDRFTVRNVHLSDSATAPNPTAQDKANYCKIVNTYGEAADFSRVLMKAAVYHKARPWSLCYSHHLWGHFFKLLRAHALYSTVFKVYLLS